MTLYTENDLTRLIISPMLLFTKTLRTVMTLRRCYDVKKLTVDIILFKEIQCKKRYIQCFNSVSSANMVGIR